MQGSVYTYIIWMICTIEYLRADFDWIIPSDSSRHELRTTHLSHLGGELFLGSLTDDSATTAPKLNNYKKVQWTSFLLDVYLNYLQGEKIENQMLSKEFFYLLWFCLELCASAWVRCPSGVAWVPCEMRPAPTLSSFGCLLSSLLVLALEPITETTEQMLSKCSCFIFAWFFLYPLFFAQ